MRGIFQQIVVTIQLKICKEFSKNINFKFIYSSSDIKKKILKLNSDKSRYLLKWKTQLSFKMIRLTSEWYKEFLIGKILAIYALIKLKNIIHKMTECRVCKNTAKFCDLNKTPLANSYRQSLKKLTMKYTIL